MFGIEAGKMVAIGTDEQTACLIFDGMPQSWNWPDAYHVHSFLPQYPTSIKPALAILNCFISVVCIGVSIPKSNLTNLKASVSPNIKVISCVAYLVLGFPHIMRMKFACSQLALLDGTVDLTMLDLFFPKTRSISYVSL